MKYLNKKNKGYTLVELILVTALIATIIVGIYYSFKVVKKNQKTEETTQLVKLVLERIDEAAAAAGDYRNFTTDISSSDFVGTTQSTPVNTNLINSKIIPTQYISGGYVTSPIGMQYVGFLNLTNQALTTTVANRNLFVSVFAEDPGQCIKMATVLAPTYQALSMIVVNSSGTTQWYGDSLIRPFNAEFNRVAVENYCLMGVRGVYLNFGISKPA